MCQDESTRFELRNLLTDESLPSLLSMTAVTARFSASFLEAKSGDSAGDGGSEAALRRAGEPVSGVTPVEERFEGSEDVDGMRGCSCAGLGVLLEPPSLLLLLASVFSLGELLSLIEWVSVSFRGDGTGTIKKHRQQQITNAPNTVLPNDEEEEIDRERVVINKNSRTNKQLFSFGSSGGASYRKIERKRRRGR